MASLQPMQSYLPIPEKQRMKTLMPCHPSFFSYEPYSWILKIWIWFFFKSADNFQNILLIYYPCIWKVAWEDLRAPWSHELGISRFSSILVINTGSPLVARLWLPDDRNCIVPSTLRALELARLGEHIWRNEWMNMWVGQVWNCQFQFAVAVLRFRPSTAILV